MTTFEHAMLGINGALAMGLHRRHGWQIVAVAGLAAVSPDWDGLTIVFSMEAFAEGHRVWGHNLLVCVIVGVFVGVLDYQYDVLTRVGRALARGLRLPTTQTDMELRSRRTLAEQLVWIAVAVVAALSQLPADMVVSGSATLPDWELKLLWPFSDRGYVYPLVSWGDVGITLIFILGMFAMIRWRARTRLIPSTTLLLVIAYIVVRGTVAA